MKWVLFVLTLHAVDSPVPTGLEFTDRKECQAHAQRVRAIRGGSEYAAWCVPQERG